MQKSILKKKKAKKRIKKKQPENSPVITVKEIPISIVKFGHEIWSMCLYLFASWKSSFLESLPPRTDHPRCYGFASAMSGTSKVSSQTVDILIHVTHDNKENR